MQHVSESVLMDLKRRRCQLCRFRRCPPTYDILSPEGPREKHLYGPLLKGRLRDGGLVRFPFLRREFVYDLCDKCRVRYDAVRTEQLPEFATYLAWVSDAPLIDTLPGDLVSNFHSSSVKPGESFVELMDADYAAEALARDHRGWHSRLQVNQVPKYERRGAKPFLPTTYRDVVYRSTRAYWDQLAHWKGSSFHWTTVDSVKWKGSVHRWSDGRILLHWHTTTNITPTVVWD